ncbi:hypothetical protein [Streptomyces candidus]|uniref:Uncharacterized protein n=1 Tax=Streptomyces candidus TaxID=67283 RepID=A0A7X0LSZ5_9ACTN|nr:hypothetical protein [Streptomyces candidus]MBB6439770.1 hypothetical protein [Streptomyces candidus]GHH56980.1 hypothetical protein GCM10018773_63700 [Streptomyces candidus]
MRPLIGLSSGSAPGLDATELAGLALSAGGTAVDVREGKGHAWETGGLDGLRTAGAKVCFVGVGTVLGDAAHPPIAIGDLRWPERGLPVKVFAAAGCTAHERIALTLAQVEALAARVGDRSLVLVETHHGYAPVPELEELCRRAGTSVLLDTMGLARIDDDPVAAAARLAPWVSYAQVKGFDWDQPGTSRHRPLASARPELNRRVLDAAGELRAVTVESKAPSLVEDIALLCEWYVPDAPAPRAPREETTS